MDGALVIHKSAPVAHLNGTRGRREPGKILVPSSTARDCNPDQVHWVDGLIIKWAGLVCVYLSLRDRVSRIHSSNDLSKHSVVSIEGVVVGEIDVEL